MLAWLTLGFLIGLQHAFEADHVAAVAALVGDKKGIRRIARLGAIWGLGHTATLAVFGGLLFGLKITLDAQLTATLELIVGIMLVALGGRIIYRLIRDRVHFHSHLHNEDRSHFHAHSHRGDVSNHTMSRHAHDHAATGWRTSLLVGMMHGLAGSAAIVALTGSTASSLELGVLFFVLFGAGSIAGMAALSAVIAIPLSITAGSLTWLNRALQTAAGIAAVGIGALIVTQSSVVLAGAA